MRETQFCFFVFFYFFFFLSSSSCPTLFILAVFFFLTFAILQTRVEMNKRIFDQFMLLILFILFFTHRSKCICFCQQKKTIDKKKKKHKMQKNRIGLPAYDWGANCIHGVQSRCGTRCPTSFPNPSVNKHDHYSALLTFFSDVTFFFLFLAFVEALLRYTSSHFNL